MRSERRTPSQPIIETFKALPATLRKTLTWDREMELAQHTQEVLDYVANQLNERPRKTLKFKTPKQLIEESVALTS